MQNDMKVRPRLRFSPSPTGCLHLGGVRTALYNYLYAKKNGGDFILRIEDTDSSRFVPGAEQYIIDTFKWLGLDFDEGPHIGGKYGPYRQSDRKDIYIKYVNQLLDSGKAYYAFDTKDEIDALRNKECNFSYDIKTRKTLKNSLTLSKDEVDTLLSNNTPYVVRIMYPDVPVIITVNDTICGKVTVKSDTLDDKVLWKSEDQLPTYHLANIVDDHLMEITQVIRGGEWLPSAPMHVFLYSCFGWDAPVFTHLPLILKPAGMGNGKLSKRDGDIGGFSVFPLPWVDPTDPSKSTIGFKGEGYTPAGMINMLAFLGWNPGTTKEVYTLDELINDFSLDKVGKTGAKYNPTKARWFNNQHLKLTDTSLLVDDFKNDLISRNIVLDDKTIYTIVNENKNKVDFIKDLFNEVNFFFERPTVFDAKVLKKWKDTTNDTLLKLASNFTSLTDWNSVSIQKVFENFVNDSKLGFSDVAPFLRLVLTGKGSGQSMFDIMQIIGKDETLERIYNFKTSL